MRKPSLSLAAMCLFAILFLGAYPSSAQASGQASPWSFHSEIDLFLGLKVGAEYRFSEEWGIRGSLGACVISPLQTDYTIVGIRHFRASDDPFQLDLQFGLIQGIFNVLEPILDLDPDINWASAYWVPGACIAIGHRGKAGHGFAFRAGGGILFGYDIGAWQRAQLHLNLGLEYSYRPPR